MTAFIHRARRFLPLFAKNIGMGFATVSALVFALLVLGALTGLFIAFVVSVFAELIRIFSAPVVFGAIAIFVIASLVFGLWFAYEDYREKYKSKEKDGQS